MNKIIRMSEQLSNMIAAGEVIERPASVVKELVENAVDAKSTQIEVQLQDAGIRQIKVIDNGEGMSESDVLLAFERHATSKVKTHYDIFRIQTLGFRGEALPSIASVSDVHVRTSNGETGVHLNIKGGEVIVNEPGALRKGTEMEINHLFFNTPARLKHIKSLNTELSHITDYVNKISLSHPEVAIKLFNNGRLLFQSSGQRDLQSVISSVYGFDIAKKMIPIKAADEDFKIGGFISDPIINRASRNYVTLIVNGRAIRNFGLTRTILEAYHTFLPKDKFPIVVLTLELDPILVDVNVHPAKLEVRFSKEEALRAFIYTEIKRALSQFNYIPQHEIKTPVPKPAPVFQNLDFGSIAKNEFRSARIEAVQETKAAFQVEAPIRHNPQKLPDRDFSKLGVSDPIKEDLYEKKASQPLPVSVPTPDKKGLELYYIGQLHGTYLLAQNEEGLFIVDQHAAMERVEYEKNYELLGSAAPHRVEPLFPLVFNYPATEILVLEPFFEELFGLGFEFETFGAQALVVRALPVWAQKDGKEIVETLILQVLKTKKADLAKLREAVAITMSCKGSIKANQYINQHEIEELLRSLCQCQQPYTCPHGRPIIVNLSKYEIEKMFKRVM